MTRIRYRPHSLFDHPPGVRRVTRGTRYGNPYVWRLEDHRAGRTLVADRAEAVTRYRADLEARAGLAEWLAPLADATALACFCAPDELCHADVLLDHLERLHPLEADR